MGPKTPDPIDVHVGHRLRLFRTQKGVSQEALGAKLGITFQQVQKYEKGTNRISASRLQHCAKELQVKVADFFDGMNDGDDGHSPVPQLSKAALDIAVAYDALQPVQKQALSAMMETFKA